MAHKGLGRAVETCRLTGSFQSSPFPALPSPLSRPPENENKTRSLRQNPSHGTILRLRSTLGPLLPVGPPSPHLARVHPLPPPRLHPRSLLVRLLLLAIHHPLSHLHLLPPPPQPQPPRRPYLILFTDDGSPVTAYHPSHDCWLSFRLPTSLSTPHASAGSLVMAEAKHGHLAIFDLFSGAALNLPDMARVLRPYALVLIEEYPW